MEEKERRWRLKEVEKEEEKVGRRKRRRWRFSAAEEQMKNL